jgi:hypothetical protein
MEKYDEAIIAKYIDIDAELKRLIQDHLNYESILEDFNKRVYLTPEEEIEKKKIQKLKLIGKDKIEQILAKYRD